MGLFDNLKSMLPSKGVDVSVRFDRRREAISGSMSKFYLAFDTKTRQEVGLKILDKQKTEAFNSRFKLLDKPSEGQIAISLQHPHIVKTIEHGITKNGEEFVVSEFLKGPGLNSLIISQSELLDGKRLTLIRQAAEALAAVHAAGYIHRDICSRNFIVRPTGDWLWLIDFGLTLPATAPFMQPGNRTGTPSYMAPEIVRRRKTDQRLDIFAFGVTAFEMCTFQLPWPSADVTGRAALAHDTVAPADICELRPQIDPTLAKTIMRCLSADPAGRPQSAEELLRLLADVEHEDVK
jgi:serine/threonine-protein kinase